MKKNAVVIILFSFICVSCAQMFMKVKKDESITVSEEAISTHNSFSFIADLHSDALLRSKKLWKNNSLHVNFSKMREGNAALQVFGIVTRSGIPNMDSNKRPKVNLLGIAFPRLLFMNDYKKAINQIDKLHLSEKKDDKFHIIKSKQDLENLIELRIQDSTHIGGMLCLEGVHCIGDSIENIDNLYNKGLRLVGLAHFFDNKFAGSQSGFDKYGVTSKGIELLERMDSLGVIIDLAHSSLPTIDAVLERYSKPPVVSHVGCAEVQNSTRNLSDDYLKKILDRGGLIGVMFFDPINRKQVSVDNIVSNIVHLIKLNNGSAKGIALGSDYDGMTIVPFDISDLNILTYKLLESGISKEDIKLIMGENAKEFFLNNL